MLNFLFIYCAVQENIASSCQMKASCAHVILCRLFGRNGFQLDAEHSNDNPAHDQCCNRRNCQMYPKGQRF